MNVLVLNGSPKGENSITLQTVYYLQKIFSQHTFDILHVGQRIKALEKNFTPAIDALVKADVLLFSYPVYTFIAPCQLHRFIELMKEYKVPVTGKYATQLTTSKHFYDVTAHRYIQENCHDLGLKYIRGLSADMEDLLKEQGQKEAKAFWEHFCFCVEQNYEEPCYTPACHGLNSICDSANTASVSEAAKVEKITATLPAQPSAPTTGDVVIVTDCTAQDVELSSMIARFQAVLPYKTRIANITEYPLRGGCLGCFNCATDGKCIYTDGFDTYLRDTIQSAQAIIYAFTIRDHSMGARFKMYDDRQFCNGHRTVTMGTPMGYLISGTYSTETNLQTILEARAQVGGNILAGIATNERNPDKEIDALANSLSYAIEHKYTQPQNFYGVGGMKIFRDLIYQMQGMMKADHRFFKSHGQYDFPQKNKGTILKMYLVGALLSSPKIKSKMGNKMNEGMLAPYKKVLDATSK